MAAASAIILSFFLAAQNPSLGRENAVFVEEYSLGSFHGARRVNVGTDGTLYILDADENKIYQYETPQSQPRTIGGYGWNSTTFDTPTGITTDGVNVYVSDYGNHRIQRFDKNLNYISSLSTRDTSDLVSRFGYPRDVAISKLGDLFVLDGENLRVLKFSQFTSFNRSFGDMKDGKSKLQDPSKIIVTLSRIFVSDRTRLVVYDYFGNILGAIGEGVVSNLRGFTLLSDGYLTASADTMWWFSREGMLQQTIPLDQLITSEKIDKIQDLTFWGDRLYLLSPRKLFVFKIHE